MERQYRCGQCFRRLGDGDIIQGYIVVQCPRCNRKNRFPTDNDGGGGGRGGQSMMMMMLMASTWRRIIQVSFVVCLCVFVVAIAIAFVEWWTAYQIYVDQRGVLYSRIASGLPHADIKPVVSYLQGAATRKMGHLRSLTYWFIAASALHALSLGLAVWRDRSNKNNVSQFRRDKNA